MVRPKKDGHFFTCYLRKDILEILTEYSNDTGIPKTIVVEKALLKFFKDMNKRIVNDKGQGE